jgi:hypothetical protein
MIIFITDGEDCYVFNNSFVIGEAGVQIFQISSFFPEIAFRWKVFSGNCVFVLGLESANSYKLG